MTKRQHPFDDPKSAGQTGHGPVSHNFGHLEPNVQNSGNEKTRGKAKLVSSQGFPCPAHPCGPRIEQVANVLTTNIVSGLGSIGPAKPSNPDHAESATDIQR